MMHNIVVFIKLIKDSRCEELLEPFNNSYVNSGQEKYYNTKEKDKDAVSAISISSEFYLVACVHNEGKIEEAFIGTGHRNNEDKIVYKILVKLEACNALKNICRLSEINLNEDFKLGQYVMVEKSELLAEQIEFIVHRPKEANSEDKLFESMGEESELHKLAQRNEYCRRQYSLQTSNKNRTEFRRDYERIIHSKSFRRMVDKAQVFSADKGDYYRTRMTHSQAVAQISCGISSGLKLNQYLTEAIALGHDIGHTPFGHQGERTLNNILRGEGYDIIKNLDMLHIGGFKHNYQSIRVASILEETYASNHGMDLSFQTLEGILKHTKLKKDEYNIESFVNFDKKSIQYDLVDENGKDVCSTLEGQVVAIADEIAQRGHDLDDALASGTITYDDFKNHLSLKKFGDLKKIVKRVEDEINEAKKNHIRFANEEELRNSRIVSNIITFFISDVIDTSERNIKQYSEDEFLNDGFIVKTKLISFSKTGETLNNYLETIIENRVINNTEVSLFDSNASTIVSSLFKAYYDNPRLLHEGTKRKLYYDIRKETSNVIDFETGNHEIIDDEFYMMSKMDFTDEKDIEKIRNKGIKFIENEYLKKREMLIRHICDYISGMTDSYAKKTNY